MTEREWAPPSHTKSPLEHGVHNDMRLSKETHTDRSQWICIVQVTNQEQSKETTYNATEQAFPRRRRFWGSGNLGKCQKRRSPSKGVLGPKGKNDAVHSHIFTPASPQSRNSKRIPTYPSLESSLSLPSLSESFSILRSPLFVSSCLSSVSVRPSSTPSLS